MHELRTGERVRVDVAGLNLPGGVGGDTATAEGVLRNVDATKQLARIQLDARFGGREVEVPTSRVSPASG